jgi:hypothetical protein
MHSTNLKTRTPQTAEEVIDSQKLGGSRNAGGVSGGLL